MKGPKEVSDDSEEAMSGSEEVSDGFEDAMSGSEEVSDGFEEAMSGSEEVSDGPEEAMSGSEELSDDSEEPVSGSEEASDGPEEGVSGSEEARSGPEEESDDEEFGGSHKKSLANLQQTDPEFYKFLKENDRNLLEYSSSEEEETTKETGGEDNIFKPPSQLHVDSEESDFEDSQETSGNLVTMAMVTTWRKNLIDDPSVQSISHAVEAFHAALDRVTGSEGYSALKVEGSGVFNAIIEMCVLHLHKSIMEFLKLNPTTIKHPEKAKKWVKIKTIVEGYFTDLFKLLGGVASENIMNVLLKHLHSCCTYILYFNKLSKIALKNLTTIWSTGEESVRVLAYLCILRLCTIKKSKLLNIALKFLYIAYIRGSKFVSINSLAQINFMRKSLVDLFALDPVLSYQHAFLYIRQLAIHLRNAVTIQKKESFQSVYNWQYIHSLKLWVELMCETNSPELRQLVYPLVQVIIGTIKLIPTAQYIPLRFHCIQMLVKLTRDADTYIPVLPFIIDSLSCGDINRQYKNVTMKPFDFTFVLRLSKAAMNETGFPDAVVESVYQLLLEYGAACSHSIAFPDLFVPISVQLKVVIKNCKTSKYTNKLKQVLIKIEENTKFLAQERAKLTINLNEIDKIKAFESEMKLKVPPLQKYWDQLRRINEMKISRETKEEKKKVNDHVEGEIPTISKEIKKKRKTNREGPVELLPSDESDFEFPQFSDDEPKEKRKHKKVKKGLDITTIDNESLKDDISETAEDGYVDELEDLNINTF